MHGGSDDTVRVGNGSESQSTERADTGGSSVGVLAMVLLVGAAVLGALGVYSLANTCWADSWFSGCREDGAAYGVALVLAAQIVGVIGFALLRRASRGYHSRMVVPEGTDPGSRAPAMSGISFLLGVVLSVLLVGVAAYALYMGFLTLAFACWPDPWCEVGSATAGFLSLVSAEIFALGAFVVARHVFRRRPWRRDGQA